MPKDLYSWLFLNPTTNFSDVIIEKEGMPFLKKEVFKPNMGGVYASKTLVYKKLISKKESMNNLISP